MEEELREAAACGDVKKVSDVLACSPDIDINSQNPVNKWTALHWACKRNQVGVVRLLIDNGASSDLKNSTSQTAAMLTTDSTIYRLLTGEELTQANGDDKPTNGFTPAYLSHPSFPSYYSSDMQTGTGQTNSMIPTNPKGVDGDTGLAETVLKVRKFNDADFIEVELDNSSKNYQALVDLLTEELELEQGYFGKIRKLPNTIIRKDKDVVRLADYQELEVVPSNEYYRPGGLIATSVHRANPIDKSVVY